MDSNSNLIRESHALLPVTVIKAAANGLRVDLTFALETHAPEDYGGHSVYDDLCIAMLYYITAQQEDVNATHRDFKQHS
jgi:hypothetical protein